METDCFTHLTTVYLVKNCDEDTKVCRHKYVPWLTL